MLSIQPIHVIMILINVMVGLLLVIFFWGKNDQSARLWAYASFCLSLGFSLIFLRAWIPGSLRYIGVIFFTIFPFFLYVKSVKCLTDEHSGRIWLGALISFAFAVSVFAWARFLTYVGVYTSLGFSLVYFWSAFALRKSPQECQNPFVRFLSLLFVSGGICWALRAILNSVFNFEISSDSNYPNLVIVILTTVIISLRHVMYLLLRFGGADREKEQIAILNAQLSRVIEQKNTLIKTLSTSVKANHIGGAVAGIVHELSQPIGTVGLNTQLLIRNLNQPEDAARQAVILNHILQDNRRAATIISRLRNFYQKGETNHAEFDLTALVNSAIELITPMFRGPNILIRSYIDPDIKAWGDPGEIEMVLVNLLNNSLNALSPFTSEAKIVLALWIEADAALIDVSDNGHGIPEAIQSDIFNLFHSTKSYGLGVGLWLSRAIMENHGGTISLLRSSTAGTCFRVAIPLAPVAECTH